ncbi:peptide ABC transporter substrate-binding protein [Symbiobacterium thermophilum]|uniref:peptide ABC transporter substrate-binding protein n=1 Tax=Symbiobacterium thermophilum TaxID=2734 RepID=UPI0005B8EE2C|nr:peptide ABC transporter substrate-binding protein [Symbiobacterium thermophilum]
MRRRRPPLCLTLAVAGLLLGGCVAAAQPDPAALAARAAPSPVSPASAEVRLHLPVEPVTLDPARTAEAVLLDVVGNLMEGLVAPEGTMESPGGVAERWESADHRQFTFYLRPEARWSDGVPVTAHDFVRAWLHLLDPAEGAVNAHLLYEVAGAEAYNGLDPADPDFAEQAAALREGVQVVAVDDRTLQVTLKAPNPEWPRYTGHPALAPRRADLPFGAVSNGPFVLAGSGAGGLRLERNPYYWNRSAVQLDAVTYHVEPDPYQALRLFQLGHLHLVLLPADLAAQVPGAQAMAQPATMGLVFNAGQPRLAHSGLRTAIALALDVQRLTAEAVGEAGLPALTLVPPSLGGGWPPAEAVSGGAPGEAGAHGLWSQGSLVGELLSGALPGAELQEARRLWGEARAELGLDRVTLTLLHAEEAGALAGAVKRSLEERLDGLTVELHTVPFAQRLERVRFGQFDLVLQGWVADHDDPMALLAPFTTAHPGNAARWVSADYDALVAAAGAAAGSGRAAVLRQAEQLLLSEAPVVPVYHPLRHWAVRPELEGMQVRPLGARFDLRQARLAVAPPG